MMKLRDGIWFEYSTDSLHLKNLRPFGDASPTPNYDETVREDSEVVVIYPDGMGY